MSSFLTLARALDPDREDWRIQRARERQFLQRQDPQHERTALLEQWTADGIVASDAEVEARDREIEMAWEALSR